VKRFCKSVLAELWPRVWRVVISAHSVFLLRSVQLNIYFTVPHGSGKSIQQTESKTNATRMRVKHTKRISTTFDTDISPYLLTNRFRRLAIEFST